MEKCFINGLGCVSAQNTSSYEVFLENQEELLENAVKVHKPNYKEYISPGSIRRMASGVKNGVVAASIALKEAGIENPSAIITGTGMGCLIDSERFLKKIIDNNEEFLTPTAFIQSTHNTVGGQVALGLKCKSYNVTYAHSATSFETSLIDALLMVNDGETDILVGGIDELSDYTVRLYDLIDRVKKQETLSEGILKSNSKGAIFSEGAQFFCLENQQKETTYAELVAVDTFDTIEQDNLSNEIEKFLAKSSLTISDVDLVVLGNNGDITYDSVYSDLQETLLNKTQQVYYKHLSGEYNTVSSFGFWLACQICKSQTVPNFLKLNDVKTNSFKNVLLYNNYLGEDHSFTLLRAC